MSIVTTLIDALRRFGSPTQRTALERQEKQLEGKRVIERSQRVSRSELGNTAVFVATSEPEPETVTPLSEDEIEPILKNAALVENFLAAFPGADSDDHWLDRLDNAFGAWMETSEKRGYSDEAVINILGAAFGKFCADSIDMRWIRIEDADGTAIAIQNREQNFRCFPFHAIAKRIRAGEYGFLKSIYISLQDTAEQEWEPTRAP